MNGLKIGDVTIPGRVLIAPMTGVSDLPFRQTASGQGAPYVATEMVACDSFARGRPDVVRRAAIGDGLPLMVIQLVGREAEWIAKGAKLAEQAGADIIDFNMGCPAKEVTGALSGSALMRDPELAARLIGAAVNATSRPVTLKMRLGWDEYWKNAPEIAARAEQIGRASHHRAWPHPPAILQGQGRLARRGRGQAGGEDSRDRQWRHHRSDIRANRAGAVRRRCGDDRARQLWPALDRGRAGNGADGKAARWRNPTVRRGSQFCLNIWPRSVKFYGDALGLRVFRKHLGWYVENAPFGTAEGRRAVKATAVPDGKRAALEKAVTRFWRSGLLEAVPGSNVKHL